MAHNALQHTYKGVCRTTENTDYNLTLNPTRLLMLNTWLLIYGGVIVSPPEHRCCRFSAPCRCRRPVRLLSATALSSAAFMQICDLITSVGRRQRVNPAGRFLTSWQHLRQSANLIDQIVSSLRLLVWYHALYLFLHWDGRLKTSYANSLERCSLPVSRADVASSPHPHWSFLTLTHPSGLLTLDTHIHLLA